jgi:4-amino-4-deoxy-L-arabinose transferase-like glycosyltransferase
MSIQEGLARVVARRLPYSLPRLRVDGRSVLVFAALTGAVLLLRLPAFFEPPWHTDEGIFAAVATRLVHGGELYTDAWESKPPLFLYLYAATQELLGAGVPALRLAATVSAIGTQWAMYGVACHMMSRGQALAASFITGVLLGVPFWEGTLALTEVFAVLPTSLAVLAVLRSGALGLRVSPGEDALRPAPRLDYRWLFGAGLLFGVAFLLRQTAAVVMLAAGFCLLLDNRRWPRAGAVLGTGFLVTVVPAAAGFAPLSSFHWFWDANVGFLFSYVPTGQQIPFHYRPLILLPVLVAAACLVWYRRRERTPRWGLAALWLVLTLMAALLTGRPYSHYFLQVAPPLALLVAFIAPAIRLSWRPRREHVPALALAASLVALWLGVVRPEFHGNLLAMRYTKDFEYYANFAGWASGLKDRDAYERYFDKRVYLTEALSERLRQLARPGDETYIWGEYPWVYAMAGVTPATRYMSSFYVLLIPYLDVQLHDTLEEADPRFIVVLADVWPRFPDDSGVMKRRLAIAGRGIDQLLARRYEQVDVVGRARIFERTTERPFVGQHTAQETHLGPFGTGRE